MTDLITADSIEETNAYKLLQGFQKNMATKRDNRAILEVAFIHYKATGVILPQLSSNNTKILTEIIEKDAKRNST